MFNHKKLIDLFLKLGYPKTDGLCHGFSLRWIEACLLGEEEAFNKRIAFMMDENIDLIALIQKAKENKWKNITGQEEALLDVLAFFDSLALYQKPTGYISVFNASKGQCDIEVISQLASSERIADAGGLAQFYLEAGIYTEEELKTYLDNLAHLFESSEPKETVGILLMGRRHSITLTYIPGSGFKWMDVNFFPQSNFFVTSVLAELITISFNPSEEAPSYLAFTAYAFMTGNNLQTTQLKNNLEQFKKTHIITKEIASRREKGLGLSHMAAQQGDADVITALGKAGADLNQVDGGGNTPAHLAVINDHADVITALGTAGADLNQVDGNGNTPAHLAALQGYADMITELGKAGADLNQVGGNGNTPAHLATQFGHADVITALGKAGADLNQVDGNGTTPAHWAVLRRHADMITALGKAGADLNQVDGNGNTPAHWAAQFGHADVITALGKAGVDLNQVDGDGDTLAHLATQFGHADVITALGKAGVDLNQTDRKGDTPAHKAARLGHTDVITALVEVLLYRLEQVKSDTNKETGEHIKLNEQCKIQLQRLIAHVRRFNAKAGCTNEEKVKLVDVLDATEKLLSGGMTANAYQAFSETMPDIPSVGLQVLGALMMALGFSVAALGVLATPMGLGAVAVGTTGALLGYGLFRYASHADGLSHNMNAFREAYDMKA
jgi:ankyrin repeat protein